MMIIVSEHRCIPLFSSSTYGLGALDKATTRWDDKLFDYQRLWKFNSPSHAHDQVQLIDQYATIWLLHCGRKRSEVKTSGYYKNSGWYNFTITALHFNHRDAESEG